MNRKIALKIKVKHLAEEARIIRKEEQKSAGDLRNWLYLHRINNVRSECRATHIAYAFAKGKALKQVEKYPQDIPMSVWSRVAAMTKKYSSKSSKEYKDWVSSSVVEQ